VALMPPFVYLQAVVGAVTGSHIAVGAQDVYFEQDGAFTGEISVSMLKDIGCAHVLCGHSERRHVIGETDELVNRKVTAAINGGLLPVLCVGELLEERKADKTAAVVERQLRKGLAGLGEEKLSAVTIAYEPVWAIGTGLTASPEQAQDVHALIRRLLAEIGDEQLGQVGGASLKAEDFIAIIEAAA
jgi:triosephosphate isomerase